RIIYSDIDQATKPRDSEVNAFPVKEVITNNELYPIIDSDPIAGLRLRPDTYGDLRPDHYYAAFGYLHVPALIPLKTVDALVVEYNKTLKTYNKPLLRQGGPFEVNDLSSEGCT